MQQTQQNGNGSMPLLSSLALPAAKFTMKKSLEAMRPSFSTKCHHKDVDSVEFGIFLVEGRDFLWFASVVVLQGSSDSFF